MPDIAMCRNKKCTLKNKCYRFKAEPNPLKQDYAYFEQKPDGNCDFYWKMDTEMKREARNEKRAS